MKRTLLERLAENFADCQSNLFTQERKELIENAAQISDTINTYRCMTARDYTKQELSYLLEFQNPLAVVAGNLPECNHAETVLSGLIADMTEQRAELTMHPLMKDAPAQALEPMYRFMNLDIQTALEQILQQWSVSEASRYDLQGAVKTMKESAESTLPEARNFIVYFLPQYVDCLNEREIFLRGSFCFETCQFFHTEKSEPMSAYRVEITGMEDNQLTGNLYQLDYHQLAVLSERSASLFTDVTVTFKDGQTAQIPHMEFFDRGEEETEYQYNSPIIGVHREAEDESAVRNVLQREHSRQENLPVGNLIVHTKSLERERIQAEADRIIQAFQELKEPNSPDQKQFAVCVSDRFCAPAEQRHFHVLMNKLEEQMPDKLLFLANASTARQKQFSVRFWAEPSVLKRLAEKSQSVKRTDGQQHRHQSNKEAR